jgi:hypothetical protein
VVSILLFVFRVSVVDRCKFSIGAWVECLHALGLCAIVVLFTIRQGYCVGMGMFLLSL